MGKELRPAVQSRRSLREGSDRWTQKQRALYEDLRSTYERLCVLARDGRYERLVEEARRSDVLLQDLKREAGPVEPRGIMMTEASSSDAGARVDSSDNEHLLTEILRMRERALQALGAAMTDTQSVLARLDQSRRALGRYRSPRSAEPRLQSCRV